MSSRFVENSVGAAGHSTAYLTALGMLRNYSSDNIPDIAGQRPDATRVVRLHAWNQLGRKVKKGEHGIRILAPRDRDSPEEGRGSREGHTRCDIEKWPKSQLKKLKQQPCALESDLMPPMSPDQKLIVDVICSETSSHNDQQRLQLDYRIAAFVDVRIEDARIRFGSGHGAHEALMHVAQTPGSPVKCFEGVPGEAVECGRPPALGRRK